MDPGQRHEEARPPVFPRGRRHRQRRRGRLRVIALSREDLPEGDPRRGEARREFQRGLEKPDLRVGRLRHQPLDVVLEDGERAALDGRDCRRRPGGRRQLAGQTLEHAEEVGERAGLDQRRTHPTGVEPERSRRHGELPVHDGETAHHDVGGAEDLRRADDGGFAQRRGGRQLEPLERLQALVARHRADAHRLERPSQQRRRALGHPEQPAVAPGVLEGHDEQALPRPRLLRRRQPCRDDEHQRPETPDRRAHLLSHSSDARPCAARACPRTMATSTTHPGSPTARH